MTKPAPEWIHDNEPTLLGESFGKEDAGYDKVQKAMKLLNWKNYYLFFVNI
jgi:hypothetical protein